MLLTFAAPSVGTAPAVPRPCLSMFSSSMPAVSFAISSFARVTFYHCAAKPQFDLGKSVIMQEPMFCVCGYSAHSGNKLAKHLGNIIKAVFRSIIEIFVQVAMGASLPIQILRKLLKLRWSQLEEKHT